MGGRGKGGVGSGRGSDRLIIYREGGGENKAKGNAHVGRTGGGTMHEEAGAGRMIDK